ncbi:MAG: TIM44-like domain-containing protein [Myxococcota bacterium]|nr:TIM44-like domain-containing protein [Myxococcota bacterium]
MSTSQHTKHPAWVFFSVLFGVSVARAGAGGTEGADSTLLFYLIFLPLILGYAAYVSIMKFYATRAAKAVLARAAERDPVWDPSHLVQRTRIVFVKIQNSWSRNDADAALPLLHPDYRHEFSELVANNLQSGVTNLVSNIKLDQVDVVVARDDADNDQDMFVAHITGTMDDSLHANDGALLKTQGDRKNKAERQIDEYWRFQRSGDDWLLRQISPHDDVLDDEISIDAETLAERHSCAADLRAAVDHAEQQERQTQARYKRIAWCAGWAIVGMGYYLYFLFFRGAWRMLTELIF